MRDVYRMASMQPDLLANIRRSFLERMVHALHTLPADMRRALACLTIHEAELHMCAFSKGQHLMLAARDHGTFMLQLDVSGRFQDDSSFAWQEAAVPECGVTGGCGEEAPR